MKTPQSKLMILIFCTFFLFALNAMADQSNIELKFSHKIHVVENEMDCMTCHEQAETSTKGTESLIPSMETCGNCHDVEAEDNCGMCHSDVQNPRPIPPVSNYYLLFSHEKHVTAGYTCNDCHAGVKEKTSATPFELPTMQNCIDCHTAKKVSTECATCHTPEQRLKPVNHGPDFLHTHGELAKTQATVVTTSANCQLCHNTTQFCQKCHEGDNLDRTSHPLNYEYTHSLDAMGKEHQCSVCHTERSFCIDCHRDNQILPYNHTRGWTNRIPGDGGLHRIEAQNDLGTCMACHEQDAQQVCQPCHTSK